MYRPFIAIYTVGWIKWLYGGLIFLIVLKYLNIPLLLNVYLVVCVEKCSFVTVLYVRKCSFSLLLCVEKCAVLMLLCVERCRI